MTEEQVIGRDIYNDFMHLFYTPEINRRKELGLLNDDFKLSAAQVIFFSDGRQNIVRLNEEVSAQVKIKKGVDISNNGFWPSTKDVEFIKLNENQFLNCGHATLILLKDGYQLSFDFQYNKLICKEHLGVANEFLKTSKYALNNNFFTSFIDNSFSAIELLAKTNLLLETNRNISAKTNHKAIKAEFNNRYKNSDTEFEIAQRRIFNQLSELRSKARYLNGELKVEIDTFTLINSTIEGMYNSLNERIRD